MGEIRMKGVVENSKDGREREALRENLSKSMLD
jgi:hypothetical protein